MTAESIERIATTGWASPCWPTVSVVALIVHSFHAADLIVDRSGPSLRSGLSSLTAQECGLRYWVWLTRGRRYVVPELICLL